MTPQLLSLILSNILGALFISLIVWALGNRIIKQRRRLLPVFLIGCAAGFIALFVNLQQLHAVAWILGSIGGFAIQNSMFTRR